jgi:hypothetical protein
MENGVISGGMRQAKLGKTGTNEKRLLRQPPLARGVISGAMN